ncbi:MAG TPA: hypothetical protein VGI82_14100 [Chitinophagaceae bacterium]
MKPNQRNLSLLFALALLTATTFFLLADKKYRYDEYDRLMW